MALFSFFKTPGNQKFDYIPRYYDADKEDLNRRLRISKKVKEGDAEAVKSRISSGFRRKQKSYVSTKRSAGMRRNMFLLAIIVALIFVSYLLLTVYLPRIVNMLE